MRRAACLLLATSLLAGCSSKASLHTDPYIGTVSLPGGSSVQYNSSALAGDTLRLLYGDNGSTLLRGGEVLARASSAETIILVEDTETGVSNHYLIRSNDPDTASGRRTSIYDNSGSLVYSCEGEASATLAGDLLILTPANSYFEPVDMEYAADVCRVVELSTGEELAVPAGAVSCISVGDLLFFTVYELPAGLSSMYDDPYLYAHYAVIVQTRDGQMQKRFDHCIAQAPYGYDLPGWVLLTFFADGSYYDVTGSTLYNPTTGKELSGYERTLSDNLVCISEQYGYSSSGYFVYDLSADKTLARYVAPCMEYLDGMAVLRTTDDGDTVFTFIDRDGTASPLSGYDRSGDALVLCFTDGRVACYNTVDGSLLWESVLAQPAGTRDYWCTAVPGGYATVSFYNKEYVTLAVQIYGPEGLCYDSTSSEVSYNHVGQIAYNDGEPVFSASYNGLADAYLYDLIDSSGTVLVHTLSTAYQAGDNFPEDCFMAAQGFVRGWMNADGEWYYCESVFSSLADEDDLNYF